MNLSDVVFRGLKLVSRQFDKTRYFTSKFKFIDNMKDSEYLLIIVAGYQDYLWEDVFGRIARYAPANYDICIVSPGVYRCGLEHIAKLNEWSYLSCGGNRLAQAQNTAIKLHKNAKYIFKLDEDIYVGNNYFDGIMRTYYKAVTDNIYKVGVICPTLNVNGATYRFFLDSVGALQEYEREFGIARITCDDDMVYCNGDAAVFLWKKTLPIDKTVSLFSNKKCDYFPAAVRFSIGAFMITREVWEKAGYFKVAASGQLAWEELELCNFCYNRSYTILIAKNVFAGHFGFGPQKKIVKNFYEEYKKIAVRSPCYDK